MAKTLLEHLDTAFSYNLIQACGDDVRPHLHLIADYAALVAIEKKDDQKNAKQAIVNTLIQKGNALKGVLNGATLPRELDQYATYRAKIATLPAEQQKLVLDAFEKATGQVTGNTENSVYGKFKEHIGTFCTETKKAAHHGLNMESNDISDIAKRNNSSVGKPLPIAVQWIWDRLKTVFLKHFFVGYFIWQIRRVTNVAERLNGNTDTGQYTDHALKADTALTKAGRTVIPKMRELNEYLYKMSPTATDALALLCDYSGQAVSSVRNFSYVDMTSSDKVYMWTFDKLATTLGSEQNVNHAKNMMYNRRMKARGDFLSTLQAYKQRNAVSYPAHQVMNNLYVSDLQDLRESINELIAEMHGDDSTKEQKELLQDAMYLMERNTTFDTIHDIYEAMTVLSVAFISQRTNGIVFGGGQDAGLRVGRRMTRSWDARYRKFFRLAQRLVACSENCEYPDTLSQTFRYFSTHPREWLNNIQDTVPFIPLGTNLTAVRDVESMLLHSMADQLKHMHNYRNLVTSANMTFTDVYQFAKHIRYATVLAAGSAQAMAKMGQDFTLTRKGWNRLAQNYPEIRAAHKDDKPPTCQQFCGYMKGILTSYRDLYRQLSPKSSFTMLTSESPHPLLNPSLEPSVKTPVVAQNGMCFIARKCDSSGRDLLDNYGRPIIDEARSLISNINEYMASPDTVKPIFKEWHGYMLQIDYINLLKLKGKLQGKSDAEKRDALKDNAGNTQSFSDALSSNGCFLKNQYNDNILKPSSKDSFMPTYMVMTPHKAETLFNDLKAINPDFSIHEKIPFIDSANNPTNIPRMEPVQGNIGWMHHHDAGKSGEIPLLENQFAQRKLHLFFAFDAQYPGAKGRMYYPYDPESENGLLQFHDGNQYKLGNNEKYCAANGINYDEAKENPFIKDHYIMTANGAQDMMASLNAFAEVRHRNREVGPWDSASKHMQSTNENMRNIWDQLEAGLGHAVSPKEELKVPDEEYLIDWNFWFFRIRIPLYRAQDRPSKTQSNIKFRQLPTGLAVAERPIADLGMAANLASFDGRTGQTAIERRNSGRINADKARQDLAESTLLATWKGNISKQGIFPGEESYNNIVQFQNYRNYALQRS
ncbi:MAG: hypothetical protein LW855_05340 [Alphaproteobacteria bacterium]|jgi:hypothetical protein|nr:hypothetical protein [Alphaproteobacteria bacterium]